MARRAAEAADSAPADPGYAGLQPPAAVPDVAGYDEETAVLTPEEQAALAAQAIEAAARVRPLRVFHERRDRDGGGLEHRPCGQPGNDRRERPRHRGL